MHTGRRQACSRSSTFAEGLVGHGQQTPSAVIVKALQHLVRRPGEEPVVDVARVVTVTFRGLSNRHQPSHSRGTRITAMTERNLAKDDEGA